MHSCIQEFFHNRHTKHDVEKRDEELGNINNTGNNQRDIIFSFCWVCLGAAKVPGGSPFSQCETFSSIGRTKLIAKTFTSIKQTAN